MKGGYINLVQWVTDKTYFDVVLAFVFGGNRIVLSSHCHSFKMKPCRKT